MTIRYVQIGETKFEVTPAVLGVLNLSKYVQFNSNNDDTLSDSEVLSSLHENLQDQFRAELQRDAELLQLVAALPTRRLSMQRYGDDVSTAIEERLKNVPDNIGIESSSTFPSDTRQQKGEKNRFMIRLLSQAMPLVWGVTKDDVEALGDNTLMTAQLYIQTATPAVSDGLIGNYGDPVGRLVFVGPNNEPVMDRFIYNNRAQSGRLSVYYPREALTMGLAYVGKHRKEIAEASNIVSKFTSLSLENIGALMAYSFAEEIANLQTEDIIQDVGACYAVDCELLGKFEELFPMLANLLPYGFADYMAWSVGSLIHDKEDQGYGIGQIIPSLAMEAAKDQEIMEAFAPHLSPADFADVDAAIATVMNPAKVVYAKALTLAFVLKQLEANLFNEKIDFTLPIDWACPLNNRDAARELRLMYTARLIQMRPEVSRGLKNLPVNDPMIIMSMYEMLWVSGLSSFPVKIDGLGINMDLAPFIIQNRDILEALGYEEKEKTVPGGMISIQCE